MPNHSTPNCNGACNGIYPDIMQRGFGLQHLVIHCVKLSSNIGHYLCTVQITFIFICQTHLVFGKCVCTCVMKHSNVFRTSLNWLKNLKCIWHEPKIHVLRLPCFRNFGNFDLWSVRWSLIFDLWGGFSFIWN